MPQKLSYALFLPVAATMAAILLTGCTTSFAPDPVQTEQTSIGDLQGIVHGGQAPVVGAQIYLYAAGTTGYNTNPAVCSTATPTKPNVNTCAVSLLKRASNTQQDTEGHFYTTSDATGSFSLTGDYTCTVGTQVYLVGMGGDAGNGSNSAIMQMAALGNCPSTGTLAQQVPYVYMNEVSTAVMAYAVGGFGTTAFNISSSGTALAQTGIANAFATVPNILNVGNGQALTKTVANSNGVVPQTEINTLANILAQCVNSTGPTSADCNNLFSYAKSGGVSATDEAAAIFNIVHNPTANVALLYKIQPTKAQFLPDLGTAPTDWTLPIVYTGAFAAPFNIAFDASGNAWIGDEINGLYEVSPTGKITSVSVGNFGLIKGIAVAPNGNVWVTDYNDSRVYVVTPGSGVTKTITNGGLNGPEALSFDGTGNAYVANEIGDTVSRYNSAGTALYSTALAMPNIQEPAWIATDNNGNSWLPSQENGDIAEIHYNANSKQVAKALGVFYQSYALAVDSNSNVWLAGQNNDLYELNSSGQSINDFTGGGMDTPYMISVDGAGSVWMANENKNTVSGFSNAGAALAAAGFQTGDTGGQCFAATPDLSGNLWTANPDGKVTQLLGLAAPTAAPMVPGNLGVKP